MRWRPRVRVAVLAGIAADALLNVKQLFVSD